MSQINTIFFSFGVADSDMSRARAVREINSFITHNQGEIINIETEYQTSWFGRPLEASGIRVWWRLSLNPDTSNARAKSTWLVKAAFWLACILTISISAYFFINTSKIYALAFCLSAGAFLLVAAGLLYANERSQQITAVISLMVGVSGFIFFPPWSNLPVDPLISHTFHAPGFEVELQNSKGCVWVEQERKYDCYLTVERLPSADK